MISQIAVNTSLDRINQQAARDRSLGDPSTEVRFSRKRRLARAVSNKLHRPKQTDTAHITNRVQVEKATEIFAQSVGDAAIRFRVGCLDQTMLRDVIEHRTPRRQRNWMRTVSESVNE